MYRQGVLLRETRRHSMVSRQTHSDSYLAHSEQRWIGWLHHITPAGLAGALTKPAHDLPSTCEPAGVVAYYFVDM